MPCSRTAGVSVDLTLRYMCMAQLGFYKSETSEIYFNNIYLITYTIVNGHMMCNALQSPVMAEHDTTNYFRFKHHFSSINIQAFTQNEISFFFRFKHHFSSINIQAFTQNEITKNEQKKITYLKYISTIYLVM